MRGVRYIVDEPKRVASRSPIAGLGLDPSLIAFGVAGLAVLTLAMYGAERPSGPTLVHGAAQAAAILAPATTPGLETGAIVRDCPECPEVVVLPTGFYTVGAPETDTEARPQEKPMRGASVRQRFAVGRTEVTIAEFKAFATASGRAMPACNGALAAPAMPQNCVNWSEAVAYTQWLATRTGKAFRLPTQDEWEYAAKAHGAGAEAGPGELAAAAAAKVNAFGLAGMRGNLAELVVDCWEEDGGEPATGCVKRTVKDGSWRDAPAQSRPSARRAISPDLRSERVGFRVARDLDPAELGQ